MNERDDKVVRAARPPERLLGDLIAAVLLFHKGGVWTPGDTEVWRTLTGKDEATSKALCDFARECRAW
jgi:hypothetical protein